MKSRRNKIPHLGKNIAYLRHVAGLTQEQLADDIEITKSALGSYEEGRTEPPLETLIKLGKRFGVSLDGIVSIHLPNYKQHMDKEAAFIVMGFEKTVMGFKKVIPILSGSILIEHEAVTGITTATYISRNTDDQILESLKDWREFLETNLL